MEMSAKANAGDGTSNVAIILSLLIEIRILFTSQTAHRSISPQREMRSLLFLYICLYFYHIMHIFM